MSVRSPLGAHRRFWLLLAKPSNPAAAAAGEATAIVAGSHGRPSTSHLRLRLDLLRVRLGTLMLRDPSFTTDEHHGGWNRELRRAALFSAG